LTWDSAPGSLEIKLTKYIGNLLFIDLSVFDRKGYISTFHNKTSFKVRFVKNSGW